VRVHATYNIHRKSENKSEIQQKVKNKIIQLQNNVENQLAPSMQLIPR
jgi:hypothetical protein